MMFLLLFLACVSEPSSAYTEGCEDGIDDGWVHACNDALGLSSPQPDPPDGLPEWEEDYAAGWADCYPDGYRVGFADCTCP